MWCVLNKKKQKNSSLTFFIDVSLIFCKCHLTPTIQCVTIHSNSQHNKYQKKFIWEIHDVCYFSLHLCLVSITFRSIGFCTIYLRSLRFIISRASIVILPSSNKRRRKKKQRPSFAFHCLYTLSFCFYFSIFHITNWFSFKLKWNMWVCFSDKKSEKTKELKMEFWKVSRKNVCMKLRKKKARSKNKAVVQKKKENY